MKCAMAIAALAVVVSDAVRIEASPTFLANQGTTLYRIGSGSPETFDMGVAIFGMHRRTDTGEILATDQFGTLYRLDGALTDTPTLVPLATMVFAHNSITQVGDLLYGVDGTTKDLYSIDPDNGFQETYVGNLGSPVEHKVGALAYGGGQMFALDATTDEACTIEFGPTMRVAPPTLVPLGPLGVDIRNNGGEYFGDHYYVAVQNLTADTFEIGMVDTATGSYASMMTLADGAGTYGQVVSLTVVPEPASFVLLLACGVVMSRRRFA